VDHSVLSVLYGTLRSSTVLYSPLQYSTVLSTTVYCQYSRRTVELRVVVQQREPTEVALVERERQRPRAALGGVPQQRQVDLRYSQWKQSQQSPQSQEQSQALQRRQKSAHTRIAVRVAPMYGIGSSAASASLSTYRRAVHRGLLLSHVSSAAATEPAAIYSSIGE
jgi:hypothetical protein